MAVVNSFYVDFDLAFVKLV